MPDLSLRMNDTPIPNDNELRNDPPPCPPVEPDPGDCCGNGCDPCIFDLYEEARQHYREALAAWRERHPGVDPASVTPPSSQRP
ncbi:oxidoreductase-like domain-containing protein [Dyella acidisoli]